MVRCISVDEGEKLLQEGAVVAIPAETVYGLAAAISQKNALQQIFILKGRPAHNPLIVHVQNLAQAKEYIEIPDELTQGLNALWPGPLTIVGPLKKEIPLEITANLKTLAVRVPNHPVFLELIKKVGPIAAPSANRSGLPSATRAWHIEEDYQGQIPVVEGTPPTCGVESTILILKNGSLEIGRLGAIPIESLKEWFPFEFQDTLPTVIDCPGKMLKHYAPLCQLTNIWKEEVEAIIGFQDRQYLKDRPLYNLGNSQDPKTIAHRLFALLRQLDQDQRTLAFVDTDLPNTGLYTTIQERLHRALQAHHEKEELC